MASFNLDSWIFSRTTLTSTVTPVGAWSFETDDVLANLFDLDRQDVDLEPIESPQCALFDIVTPASGFARLFQTRTLAFDANVNIGYKDTGGDGSTEQISVAAQRASDSFWWNQSTGAWGLTKTSVVLPFSPTRVNMRVFSNMDISVSVDVTFYVEKAAFAIAAYQSRVYHVQLREA